MNTKTEKALILSTLMKFASQPPRLEVGNYVSYNDNGRGWRAYKDERRDIMRDLKTVKMLFPLVAEIVTLETLKESFRAYSGRLEWDGKRLKYTAGQYFPTEYRKAVCAVFSMAIWYTWRDSGLSPIETAKETFPHSISSTWFN